MFLKRILCLLLISTAFVYAIEDDDYCAPEHIPINKEDAGLVNALKQVETWLHSQQQQERIPSLTCAIVYDDEVLWSDGFGYADLKEEKKATPDTIYRIGSVTKVFTATMLMQLQSGGKVHLDSPISDYMSAYQVIGCAGDNTPPTLRQLASHTAGLPSLPWVDLWTGEGQVSEVDIIKSLKQTQAVLPTGVAFHYSNLGYIVLGHALSLVAKMPYAEWVDTKILKPLDMTSTSFKVQPDLRDQVATGYERVDGKQFKVAKGRRWEGLQASGGLISSASDMAKFLSLQFSDHPPKESPVLRGAAIRQMREPAYIFSDWKRAEAIGWVLSPLGKWTAYGHLGATPGYSAGIRLIPELKLGVVVLTNIEGGAVLEGKRRETGLGKAANVLEQLAPIIARLRADGLAKINQDAIAAGPTSEELQAYVGTYEPIAKTSLYKTFDVSLKDGQLFLKMGRYKGLPLTWAEKSSFRIKNRELVTFVRDQSGEVIGMRFEGGGALFQKEANKSAEKS